MTLAVILAFALGLVLGAWWGVSFYPRIQASEGPQYAIQYQEGEWLWLKDDARTEVRVFHSEAEAKLGLDAWLRRNPEYLGHCRVVPWDPMRQSAPPPGRRG